MGGLDTEQFPEFMSKALLAEMFEVSLPTAEKFLKEGLPVISEGSAGREYRIPPRPSHSLVYRAGGGERARV